jgi:hypothetical protein
MRETEKVPPISAIPTMTSLADLAEFRKRIYNGLGPSRDSLFDLMDATLTSRSLSSFVELSLSPVFRRQWSSLYKGIERGQPPGRELMKLYAQRISETPQVVLAGDHTAYGRLWSPTLKERTYEHQPQPQPGAKPITLGVGYSTIACIPEEQGSWALPLLHERITSFETPLEKAAEQLQQVCEAIESRPISLWDAEYGCARFLKLTADVDCDKLLRTRSNRVVYGPAPAYGGRGRPRKHGARFKLNDDTTWWSSDEQISVQDEKLGHLRVRCWSSVHFRESAELPMTLILVERLNAPGQRTHRPLWLIWTGNIMPALATVWRLYLRRFCVDHWYRFIKQRLHWCLPHLGSTAQMDVWSALMPLMSWQLWLARDHIQDNPLPWQTKSVSRPTPGRVANSFALVLVAIGTPAQFPKLRGKSTGWPPGQKRTPRPRYPTVKKSLARPKFRSRSRA